MQNSKGTIIAACITGVCTLFVGFYAGKAAINNSINVQVDGQRTTLNGDEIETLMSENSELKSRLSAVEEKINLVEGLDNGGRDRFKRE